MLAWSARLKRNIVVATLLLLPVLTGCSGGIAEFQIYDQAFDAQFAKGEAVLDRVARAERIVVLRREARKPALQEFDPNNAAAYLGTGDPPITAAMRASLKSVQSYNKALTGLANGESARSLSARAGKVTSNLLSASGALAVASGGSSAFAAAGAGLVGGLLPVFERVAAAANRAAFRRDLLKAYPDMRKLLQRMRDGTSEMFELIRRSYVQRGLLGASGGVPTADLPKLRQERQLLAGWVVLLDRTLVAMDSAAEASLRGASSADIAVLAETSSELRILAETIRAAETAQ